MGSPWTFNGKHFGHSRGTTHPISWSHKAGCPSMIHNNAHQTSNKIIVIITWQLSWAKSECSNVCVFLGSGFAMYGPFSNITSCPIFFFCLVLCSRLLTYLACSRHTGEYWTEVVFEQTSWQLVCTATTSGQYPPQYGPHSGLVRDSLSGIQDLVPF